MKTTRTVDGNISCDWTQHTEQSSVLTFDNHLLCPRNFTQHIVDIQVR